MTTRIILLCVIGSLLGGILLFTLTRHQRQAVEFVPHARVEPIQDGAAPLGTEVGTGWSTHEDPRQAVSEALNMALADKGKRDPNWVVIYASSGSDMKSILETARRTLGKGAKIFGGTSDSRAVMTDRGFVKAAKIGYTPAEMEGCRGLAVMTVRSVDITFGVAASDLSVFPSAREAGKAAIQNAVRDAGREQDNLPKVVLLTVTRGIEEEILEGVEEILGNSVPVLGGTAGGPAFAVLGQDKPYVQGVSLTALYTDLPVGWAFEGGFDMTDSHTGIVTRVDGQAIVEIDDRPALDVYDDWLGGRLARLGKDAAHSAVIRDFLTLHPLCRKYTSAGGQDYFLFSHPWPKDDRTDNKCVMTSTKIKIGERVYLSSGTWETLLNRIGNLPVLARLRGAMRSDVKPILSLGVICAGVMGAIPEGEREKIPVLINYANHNAPFIANFTWGEQGHFPGVGNKHGNLLTSFLIIGAKDTTK